VEPINFKRAVTNAPSKREALRSRVIKKPMYKLVINARIDPLRIPKLLEKETLRICLEGELFFPSVLDVLPFYSTQRKKTCIRREFFFSANKVRNVPRSVSENA